MDNAHAAESFDSAHLPAADPILTPNPQVQPANEAGNGSEPIATATDAVWLRDDDFHQTPPPIFHARRPGPGLPESIVWLLGVLGLQLFGAALVSVLIFAGYAASLPPEARDDLMRSLGNEATMQNLQDRFQIPMLAGSQTIFLLGVIVAARLRLGRRVADRLSLSFMPLRHFAVLVLLVVPMMIISNEFYAVGKSAWRYVADRIPALRRLDEMNSMEIVPQLASQASPLLLLFMLALVPAIAEELVFRGVIGRGLVARWRLPAGVIVTSIMFAIVHIHPAHAMAVLPLGIAMHLVYLATRSFWAPVLFHFLNNGAAVLNYSFAASGDAEAITKAPEATTITGEHASTLLFSAAVVCAIALTTLMWQMRVRYILPNGDDWSPGYDTAERPPASLGAVRVCRKPDSGVVIVAMLALLAFAAAFLKTAMEL